MTLHSLKRFFLASFIFLLLFGCQSKETTLIGDWQPENEETALYVKRLSLNEQKGLYWHLPTSDSVRYRYEQLGDTLELMNRYGIFHYRVQKLTDQALVLQTENGNGITLSFKRMGALIITPDATKPHIPTEKNVNDLIYALTGPTVELRLRNLLDEFAEGDFVTTPTLYKLTGVSQYKKKKEYPEEASYRSLIQEISSIKRIGDKFQLRLRGGKNIRASLPINSREPGKGQRLTTLDLFIRRDASVMIEPTAKGIKLDIDGVRVGKGWLKVGLPTFRIKGDYGSLLGFRFYLAR